jgi:hypothetical protein
MHSAAYSVLISLLLVSTSLAQYYETPYYGPPQRHYGHGPIKKDELEQQQQAFKQWWGDEYVTKLSELPAEGKVPDFRVPYAGHDYPDRGGGTVNAMSKYDRAFHRGRPLATQFEQTDISDHRAAGGGEREVRGLFGRVRMVRGRGVPTWYGHCNGWTAAAIRHAEPQQSVVRNGVVFTPADIKGLLAEIYMYTESEFLGGIDPAINPGILHLSLANWLGRGDHPLGMETAVGEVVINFPLFAYKSTINRFSQREAEVRTIITYALNINREMDKQPPKYHRQLYFHYVLDLDKDDNIKGGRYYTDSGQIDMLWAPLKPSQGGDERNKRGNPHLDVKEVLAIWRESVPEDLRKQWLNIDPTEEDRILPPEALATTEQPSDATASGASTSSAVATDVTIGGSEAEGATGEAASGSAEAATGGESIAAAPSPNRDGQLDNVPPSVAPVP